MTNYKQLLHDIKTIVIIGAKDAPGQPVDKVGRYLIEAGYTVFPVHPKRQNVWGMPTFQCVANIPQPVDLVDVFRAPQFCPSHAEECLQLPVLPRIFWMQLGITSEEASRIMREAGVQVVQDACLMVELKKLQGTL